VLDRVQHAITTSQEESVSMAAKKKAKKAAKKKAPAKKRKPNAAFMKPVTPNEKLAMVVGASPLPRTELTKKLWVYIKKHGLQDKKNRRMINADAALKAVFGGKAQVSMFDMTKLVSKNLK
jgi:chromatin remodeling complex protein RSC6